MSDSGPSVSPNSAPSRPALVPAPPDKWAAPSFAIPYRSLVPKRARRVGDYHQINLRVRRINRWKSGIAGWIPQLDRKHHPIRHDIAGGNLEDALERAIDDVCARMTPLSAAEIQDYHKVGRMLPSLLCDDVALAVGGKIVAVIRALPTGPVVYRFDPAIY
jgi:hypothetical protein